LHACCFDGLQTNENQQQRWKTALKTTTSATRKQVKQEQETANQGWQLAKQNKR